MKSLDENHSFNIRIAAITDNIYKAILLKEIYGWCLENFRNKKHIHFGYTWTFYTAKELSRKFFYMKKSSISRWLTELEEDGWIFSANFNTKKYDHTKWYTINSTKYDNAAAMNLEDINTPSQINSWTKSVQIQQSVWRDIMSRNLSESGSQNENTFSQNETRDSQNEQPIPSLTTSLTSNTTFLGKIENSKTENIETTLTEDSECLQPFPENMPYGNGLKRAKEALNTYYEQDGKLDELRLEVGYDISSSFLDEQKKSFLEKMTNYAHNRARTFSEFKGYFVSWVRRGYEKSVKEETQKKQSIYSVQAEITADEINVAAAEVLGQVQRTPTTAKRLDAIKSTSAEQILENLKPVLELVNTWKDALSRYKPLNAKQLIWIELNHPNKTKITDALLKVVKYHPVSDTLIDAIKIQLLK